MGLRNVVHRRNHKERSQPSHRSKLGLLEKHKDYILRAKDHHSKRDRINLLKEKAQARNKDEFYFGMINTTTRNGVHITERGNRAMDNQVVQLLKTQDAAYLRTQINKERKEIEGLKNRISPSVPMMRIAWIEEKDHRKFSLLNAGLLPDPKNLARIGASKKERMKFKDRWDQSEFRDDRVGSLGNKTVWLDRDDQVRAYKPPGSKSTSISKASSSSLQDLDDDDDDGDSDSDQEMLDLREDRTGSEEDEEFEDSEEEEDDGDFADESVDEEVVRDLDEKARNAGQKVFERHLSHLLRLLLSRQTRLSTLLEASSKLSIARSLMATKGQSVKKLPSEKEKSFLEKVAQGKLTKNGLALPGNDDDEDDEEEMSGEKKKPSKNKFRWSKERKR